MLVVENISKSYKYDQILNQVSLEVSSGEIVGLVGANGAGKTTLIKAILGLHSIDGGSITFSKEKEFHNDSEKMNRIGYLLDIELFDYLTAREHIELMGMYENYNYKEDEIKKILERVSLKDDRKKVKNYSYGMKQRLRLALAMLKPRDLLILDEPLLGLDIATIQEFKRYLRAIADSGVAILLSSHQLSEIEDLIDRYLILANGEIEREIDGGTMAYRLMLPSSKEKLDKLTNKLMQRGVDFQMGDKEDTLLVTSQENLNKVLKEIYAMDLNVQIEQVNIVNQLFLGKGENQ